MYLLDGPVSYVVNMAVIIMVDMIYNTCILVYKIFHRIV